MLQNNKGYIVYGSINFPVQMKINAANKTEAAQHAHTVLESNQILKADIDLLMASGKTHFIVCEKLDIQWLDTKEE